MAGPVEVRGLKEFAAALKDVDRAYARELTKVNKAAAKEIEPLARSKASALGGMAARAAGAIRAYATNTAASIGAADTSAYPMALAALWGAKRRTGWYADERYAGGPPNLPPWVGNTWEAGVAGQGPRGINDAVAQYGDRYLEQWSRAIDDLTRKAFPES